MRPQPEHYLDDDEGEVEGGADAERPRIVAMAVMLVTVVMVVVRVRAHGVCRGIVVDRGDRACFAPKTSGRLLHLPVPRMSSISIAASVFGVVFIAELPDKTALASLVLATRHRPLPVFLGAAVALAVQSLVAVLAGHLLSLLPARPVHVGAGLLFLVTAVLMWRKKDEEDESGKKDSQALGFWRTAWLVFGVVFIAEWGDLTQLATAALAARYAAPIAVFIGATLALWAVVTIAVVVGNRAGKLMSPDITQRIAAGVFAVVGVAFVVGLL